MLQYPQRRYRRRGGGIKIAGVIAIGAPHALHRSQLHPPHDLFQGQRLDNLQPVAPGQAPPGQLVQAEAQLRQGHPRKGQQRRRKRSQPQGGKRMMAYPEVAAAPLGKGDAGDINRHPPQGADAVDMIARLHSAEAQAAPGADAAGPGAEHDNIGPQQAAAGGQG